MAALLLLPLLIICCFGPGFFLLRKVRMTIDERLCGSIGVSLILIYLLAGVVYLARAIPWRPACWGFTALAAAMMVLSWAELKRFCRRRHVRRQLLAFGLLLTLGLFLLMVIEHYSGGTWSSDWKEHYDRSLFFLQRQPYDTVFIGLYVLPARPPMMHLIAAYFLSHVRIGYESFQVISLFLNALAFFPCVLLAGMLIRNGNRKVWLIAAFLATSPVFMQNITWSWNKLLTAFFIIFSVALYLRGWRKQSPVRIIAAATSMAAAILIHYSAGPYAVFLAGHYLCMLAWRRWKLLELLGSLSSTILLLATWFTWSLTIYGASGTFKSNTTVTDSGGYTLAENIRRFGYNMLDTFVPHPLKGASSAKIFIVNFDQPNPFGLVRDYYFLFCQQSLPGTLGVVGWAICLHLMILAWKNGPPSRAIFWGTFLVITIPLGVIVVGIPDYFGVAHVCLQPLTLIGLALLAAGFGLLRPWMRITLLASIVMGLVLGIILHFRIEMLPIRGFVVNNCDIVPFSQGLINVQGVCNSFLRLRGGVPHLGDHFIPIAGLILGAVIAIYAAMVAMIGQLAVPSNTFRLHPVAVTIAGLFIIGATLCAMDRARGYRVRADLDTPLSPTPEQIQQIISPLQATVNANFESAEAHYALAEANYKLGQFDPAWKEVIRAVMLDPNHVKAHYLLGLFRVAYKARSKDEAAIDMLYDREQFDTAYNQVSYGTILFVNDFHKTAIEVLRDAVKRYPTDPGAHKMLAAALFDDGKPNEAVQENEAALRLFPGSAEIAEQLRVILKANGQDPEAIERRIREIQGMRSSVP